MPSELSPRRARSINEGNPAPEAESNRLNEMFVQAPGFMALLRGREHRFELANPGFMRLFRQRPVVGRTMAEALPEAVEQGYLALLDHVFSSGEAHAAKGASYVVRATPDSPADERFLDFVFQPIHDREGRVTGIFVEGVDVTDRVAGEAALRESKERLAALVRASAEVLYSMSADWSEMRQLSGGGFLTDTSTANPSWLGDYIPTEEQPRVRAAIQEAIRMKTLFHLEHRVRLADGTLGWILSRAVPLLDAAGEITEWFGAASDVSARRDAEEALRRLNETLEDQVATRSRRLMAIEEQLRQSQKMEAIGQLTGGLAHDVNNMLQGIGGALQLLQKRVEAGRLAELPRLFRAAQDGVDRAAALTHGLLAFARRGRLDPKPIMLDEVMEGMAELMRRTVGPGIEVRLQTADGAWTTRIDPGALESALLNLAINARDAMPGGGRLTFSTREVALTAGGLGVEAEGVEPGDFLVVSVTDTGEGMTPEVLARVVEPFFTTKPIGKGTGLGLSQTYGFVRQSGGFLRIESEPGQGTTVRLYLPRADVAPADALVPAAPRDAPADAGRHSILLVEDERTVRELAAETLRDRGYVVLEAADGPSGLAALARSGHVDLLVTDVGLPGLNGRQLADAAREQRPELPVLFITGYAGMALSDGLPPGMVAIAKPFSLDDLAGKVATMLARDTSPASS